MFGLAHRSEVVSITARMVLILLASHGTPPARVFASVHVAPRCSRSVRDGDSFYAAS